MPRYIDADALIEPMENACMGVMSGGSPFNEPMKVLKSAPTADVVEVVRCKDCKYMPTGDGANHDLEFPEDLKCPCQCEDFWYSWKPNDNWFCGNGKRRDYDDD